MSAENPPTSPVPTPARRSILGFPFAIATLALLAWQILRIVLWIRFAPDNLPWRQTLEVLGNGVFGDVAFAILGSGLLIGLSALLATILSLPALLVQAFGPAAWRPTWRWLFRVAITVGFMTGIFLLVSEWYFFAEFESRFNTVAIDYLIYPHEVFTNLRESYPLPAIVLLCAVGGLTLSLLTFRRWPPTWESASRTRRTFATAAWIALGLATATATQFSRPPANRPRILNELASNGWASALRAAWSRNLSYPDFYPVLDRTEAFHRARTLLAEPGAAFIAPTAPPFPNSASNAAPDPAAVEHWLDQARDSLRRRIAGDPSRPRRNVCIITEESLGSEFWGSLGRTVEGHPDTLTPRMDALAASEGLLFTHLLADGNRTIRGLEAVYSSFPPLPGDSILARDHTENVETIAKVLKRDGYSTLFLYAGHGTFDYIRSYSLRNGWDRLVEESDFKDPAFRTAWGVSDEDLLQRGIEEMRALHTAGKPFLTSFMTVSNHRPFTYPKGHITEDPDEHRRNNAVKYADWVLGDFFERARKEPFWQDTIFVVIADHGARVYGSQTIPLKSYQIPCLIIAPGLVKSPRRVDVPGSQLDVTPTVLGMIGRPYESLFFGHDLLSPDAGSRTRCLMHHNRSVAVYHEGHQVVLGLGKTVEYWSGEPGSGTMSRGPMPDPSAESLRDDGIALFQVADELYTAGRFNLPPIP
jgi:phosphoglycerol transferase MdoB-like AlkP superfamily enzyme